MRSSDGYIMHCGWGHTSSKKLADLHRVCTEVGVVPKHSGCDCPTCLEANARMMNSTHAAPRPQEWGHFAVDYCGPHPPSFYEGYRYTFVAVEMKSKYVFVFGARNRTKGTAKALLQRLQAKVHALPGDKRIKSILHDGGEFQNHVAKAWALHNHPE